LTKVHLPHAWVVEEEADSEPLAQRQANLFSKVVNAHNKGGSVILLRDKPGGD